jgi:hypothetical protein
MDKPKDHNSREIQLKDERLTTLLLSFLEQLQYPTGKEEDPKPVTPAVLADILKGVDRPDVDSDSISKALVELKEDGLVVENEGYFCITKEHASRLKGFRQIRKRMQEMIEKGLV